MLIVLLAVAGSSGDSFAQTAKALNTKGMKLYKQKRYVEAGRAFKRATEAGPKYALAHYNLACVCALMLKDQGCMEFSEADNTEFCKDFFEHLKISVRLNPRRRARLPEDKDLDTLRGMFKFQVLSGLSPTKIDDLKKILVNVNWSGKDSGELYGAESWLEFKPKGKMVFGIITTSYGIEDGKRFYKAIMRESTSRDCKKDKGKLLFELDKPVGGRRFFEGKKGAGGKVALAVSPGKVLTFYAGEADGDIERDRINGTYQVNGTAIEIQLDTCVNGKSSFVGKLGEDDVLKVPGLLGPYRGDSNPGVCDGA